MKIAVVYSSDTQSGIIKGLEDHGNEVIPFLYGPLSRFFLIRLVLKFSKNIIKKSNEVSFNKILIKVHKYNLKHNLDIILIIKGHTLTRRTEEILRTINVKKIQWTIDTIERWPGQASLLPYMDKVFFQDGSDVRLHRNGKWLPLGFDESLFKYNTDKEIDILMIGNVKLPFYSKRRECFVRLAFLASEGYKVCFAGSTLDKTLLSVFKSNGVKILGRQKFKTYADIISRAKICVNIHQDDGGEAINPMFFAIPATGGIEMTDDYDYLKTWLKPSQHYFPTTPDTISEDILALLPKTCLPYNLSNSVMLNHSYYARAKTILNS
jgi:hypothetical protein